MLMQHFKQLRGGFMLIDERHNQILGIVKEKTFVSVEDLAKMVYASPATIRRDLSDLEMAGLIQRVRGGASTLGASTGETSSLVRKQTNVLEKRKLATAALSFIKNGQSYFLDSSTTVGQIIPLLGKKQDVTFITTGLENAYSLSLNSNANTYITGGLVQSKVASTIGGDAIAYINHFHCDAFIFSCHGFSVESGPNEGTIEQQRCKEAMLAHSTQHILLVDHSKFDKTLVASVCPLSDLDIIITDAKPSKPYLDAFEKLGIQLVIAD